MSAGNYPVEPTVSSSAAAVNGVTLNWTPGDNGGSPIIRYEIRAIPTNAPFDDRANQTTIKTYAVTDDGSGPYTDTITLTPGVLYEIDIRAVNAVGSSLWGRDDTAPLQLPFAVANAATAAILFNHTLADGWLSASEAADATATLVEHVTVNFTADINSVKYAHLTANPGGSCPDASSTEYDIDTTADTGSGLEHGDVTWEDGKTWLCLRVSDGTTTAVSKPVTFNVDITPPALTVTNPDQSAPATARDFSARSTTGANDRIGWRIDDDATCDAKGASDFDSLTAGANARVVGSANNNKYVCFYAIDEIGNLAGTGAGSSLVSAASEQITGLTDQAAATATKVISVTADKSSVNESGATPAARTVTFTINLDAPAASDLTLQFIIRGIADGSGHNVYTDDDPAADTTLTDAQILALNLNHEGIHEHDFVTPTVFRGSTATISVSQGFSSATLSVEIADDGDYELDEVFRFRVQAGSSGLTVANSVANRADVTIVSDDAAPVPTQPIPPMPTAPPAPPSGPAAISASVSGAELRITFHTALDADAVPAASTFTVEVDPDGDATDHSAAEVNLADTDPVAVANETVEADGSPSDDVDEADDVTYGVVTLTLAAALTGDETVTVSYAAPDSGTKLQDEASPANPAANFTDLSVINKSAPPVFVRGAVATDGRTIDLFFDAPLDTGNVPSRQKFAALYVGTTGLVADGVSFDDADDTKVTLRFNRAIPVGAAVKVQYKPREDDSHGHTSRLKGANGSEVARFNKSVTNNSTRVDYDTDDDQLIDVSTLAQLDAIRRDLNGRGKPTGTDVAPYNVAFPNRAAGMGCKAVDHDNNASTDPQPICLGYELVADLDFADSTWATGTGWDPIGTEASPFSGLLEGNGHVISNLFINRTDASSHFSGLFGVLGTSSVVRRLGLENVDITAAGNETGAIAGQGVAGEIFGVYVTGSVTGTNNVGGLVGSVSPTSTLDIIASYSLASVTGTRDVGGLVGIYRGASGAAVTASYAMGSVTCTSGCTAARAGLIADLRDSATVTASFATARVLPDSGGTLGGLVAEIEAGDNPTVSDSYWDTDTSGLTGSRRGTAKTTEELQSPTGYSGIYASWNVDIDGETGNDDPWDFRESTDYPALQIDFDGNGTASWQEFGVQREPGRVRSLRLTPGAGQITVTWDPPDDDPALAPTGYVIRYRVAGTSAWLPGTFSGGPRSATITGLADGTEYQVQVSAYNSYGNGLFKGAKKKAGEPARPPGKVRDLALTAGNAQIVVAWSAPTDSGSPALTSYTIEHRRSGTSESWTTASATGTSATIFSLTNNQAYEVRVAAVNAGGKGPYVTRTATPNALPGVPLNLTLTAGDGQITATWDAPTKTGTPALDGYYVRFRLGSSGSWHQLSQYVPCPAEQPNCQLDQQPVEPKVIPNTGTDARTATITLANNLVYQVQVAAKNSDGAGPYTQPKSATPAGQATNYIPTADPGDDQTVAPGATVTLDGSGSLDPEGADLTYAWSQTSGTCVDLSDPTAERPTFTAPSIRGVRLEFSLVVNDGADDSDPEAPSTVTITVRGEDRDNNNAPIANAGGDQQVDPSATVRLDASGSSDSDGDSLEYFWCQTSGTQVTLSSETAQSPTFTAPSTASELTFELTVGDGTATASDEVTITVGTIVDLVTPAAPAVAVTSGSTTSLDVHWGEVLGATNYDLRYRAGTTGSWTNGPQDQTGDSAAIGSLTAGTLYEVQVRAGNSSGDSDWSPSGSGRTASTGNAAPTFSAEDPGFPNATITWP
ncbi:MAG: fibronectin type III domain-containing protein, partial [Chloroflexi bacterium]|nr:fibronectin type III domain-containing protein [Chloroflexota bacterium]